MIEPIAITVAGEEPDPEAAIPVPDHRGREIDHPPRHPAMGEEVAREDEERDRHDLEIVDAREQLQRHRLGRHIGHEEDKGQHGEAERDRDRHARQHQGDQQAEDQEAAHRSASASTGSMPST
jgi:hypothetical protein